MRMETHYPRWIPGGNEERGWVTHHSTHKAYCRLMVNYDVRRENEVKICFLSGLSEKVLIYLVVFFIMEYTILASHVKQLHRNWKENKIRNWERIVSALELKIQKQRVLFQLTKPTSCHTAWLFVSSKSVCWKHWSNELLNSQFTFNSQFIILIFTKNTGSHLPCKGEKRR